MQVGDKVVCIDDSVSPQKMHVIFRLYTQWLKKDKEYTIREVVDNDGIVTGLLLEEVVNPLFFESVLLKRFIEPAFATWRFRKVQTQKQTNVQEEEEEFSLVELDEILNPLKIEV